MSSRRERFAWRRAGAAVAAVLTAGLSGCAGYAIGSVKPSAYAHVRTVAVPTFRNVTLEPRIEALVTGAVVEALQTDGAYSVADAAHSDARLEGIITEVKRRQTRASRRNTLDSREIDFTVVIDYVFRDLRTFRVLESGTVTGTANQFLDPNFQLSERQAIPVAAERAAQNLVNRLTGGW